LAESNRSELYHQIANEMGIALGMIQLANQKVTQFTDGSEEGRAQLQNYLNKASLALGRLKNSTNALREMDSNS
jgi:hypothetical protein